jgi:hypothetical protein
VAPAALPPVAGAFYVGFGLTCAAFVLLLVWHYGRMDAERYEIQRLLVSSVMPLGILTFRRAGRDSLSASPPPPSRPRWAPPAPS